MKPLNPNSMIQGRYLIVQPIGKGGMGEVYLAVDQRLGSAVALKRTFFSEDSTLGNAFEREARILARLRHPVLPKVIDHFSENGDQFLVMEHISGDDIAKRLESANKPFPVSWVMFWSDQMLDALAYLHSHEPPIVHRDIKPQNLKLTDDNHIVLLDFGLSKDFDSTTSGGLNSASVAGYSPHFASMEQIRGTGTDARSDLYSLAATLYQMLTNIVPPDALTRADSMLGGKGDPIRPLNELNSEIAPAISDVILKAVAIRQDERFLTASEMQKALRRAFNKGNVEPNAKPVTAGAPPELPVTVKPTTDPKSTDRVAEISETPEFETQIRHDSPVPLDATLQMPSPQNLSKNSELKTAVFSAGEVAAGSTEPAELAVAASAGVAPGANMPRPVSQTPAGPASPRKKSGAGLIVGILAAFLLLVGLGSGAVWFLMNRTGAAAIETPTPVPANVSTPAVVVPVIATDTNVGTNANTAVETEGQLPVTGVAPTTAEQPATKPAPATKTQAPRTVPPAANKSAPKPKAKDDRTVILQ